LEFIQCICVVTAVTGAVTAMTAVVSVMRRVVVVAGGSGAVRVPGVADALGVRSVVTRRVASVVVTGRVASVTSRVASVASRVAIVVVAGRVAGRVASRVAIVVVGIVASRDASVVLVLDTAVGMALIMCPWVSDLVALMVGCSMSGSTMAVALVMRSVT